MSDIDSAREIRGILMATEELLRHASDLILTNPLKAQDQIARGIETLHSVRGFLL